MEAFGLVYIATVPAILFAGMVLALLRRWWQSWWFARLATHAAPAVEPAPGRAARPVGARIDGRPLGTRPRPARTPQARRAEKNGDLRDRRAIRFARRPAVPRSYPRPADPPR